MSNSRSLRVFVAEWPENQFFNLAFEEAFYTESKQPTLRFWRNDKVVVIGRFQCPPLEINAIEAKDLGVRLVRRFTGGGAVYHDLGNLNYALTLPGHNLSIEESFSIVGSAIVEALSSLGVDKVYYRPLNDIEVDGLKVSGMAACRSHDRMFIHGAMLVSSDISILWRVLKISRENFSGKKFTRSRIKRVTTLSEVLGKIVRPEELYKAISETLSRKLGLEIEWSEPQKSELKKALDLYKKKYATLEWNLKYVDEVRDLISSEEYEALKAIARPSEKQEKFIEMLSLE
ncbi:MAG: biotin/lipoate A/B protein ligase family protein [Desulfurococcaceae archaeon]